MNDDLRLIMSDQTQQLERFVGAWAEGRWLLAGIHMSFIAGGS